MSHACDPDELPETRARVEREQERPSELLDHGTVYFDASAWNDLVGHADRELLIDCVRVRQAIVLASVFSAGEILRTPDAARRDALCSLMRALHGGDRLLLERPLTLAAHAAEAYLAGDDDVRLTQTGPGRSLLAFLYRPDDADKNAIAAWLQNTDENLERFRQQVKPDRPDHTTRYHAPEVLCTDAFLQLLLTLPPAVDRGLSLTQVRGLYEHSDIWRALAATLGYIITQSMSDSPRWQNNRKRPGAPDLWQAVYLGVVHVFVTSDVRQLNAVAEIGTVFRHPRCVVSTADFLSGLTLGLDADAKSRPVCGECGCGLPTAAGVHALP